MAPTPVAPGRTLVLFGIGVALLFGLVALAGTWRPALGVDLRGGERITLQTTDEVSDGTLEEASEIVARRADDFGVSAAEVTTRGETDVLVEVPGEAGPRLVSLVQRQATLGIRLVACSSGRPGPCASPDTAPDAEAETPPGDVPAALRWTGQPTRPWVDAYADASCPVTEPAVADPSTPLVSCDARGGKYLLTVPVVDGDRLDDVEARQHPTTGAWQVELDLDGDGTRTFGEVSQALVAGNRQFAVVVDGQVVSAPSMQAVITDGRASITGDFDEQSAGHLATSLRFGALPVSFEDGPRVAAVGSTLAGGQLGAGLAAGAVALLLALGACLVRYRAPGLVIAASLFVAGLVAYAVLVLLGQGIGYTLTLAGAAGLLVALGIAADSTVGLLERIRHEAQQGKSARNAVASGWPRARRTGLAAHAVVLLAALLLTVLAVQEVRGFAIALGLVTLVDLLVLFCFTRPLVELLGQRGLAPAPGGVR